MAAADQEGGKDAVEDGPGRTGRARPLFAATDLASGAAAPLYLQVAHLIEGRIRERALPVGSLLPTENELAGALAVSRQTVRAAIAHLRERGLLSARKGVGTRVEAAARDWRRTYSARSVGDLVDLANETEMRVTRALDVAARGRLAAELGCRPGRRWRYFEGPRHHAADETAFSWSEVWLDARLAPLVRGVETFRTAVFALVEREAGEPVAEIKQDIRPCTIASDRAAPLGAPPGALALEITRRYYGAGGRLLLMSKTTLPADRFSYSMTFTPD